MKSSYTIGVFGLWHLGEIYSACLAELGHRVVGIDSNEATIRNFERGIPPLEEPRLADLIGSNALAGRLSYSSKVESLKDCNVLWITFDTPVNDSDEADTSVIMESLKSAVPYLSQNVLIVVSSQLPVGFSEIIVDFIKRERPELSFGYVYSPENLRLGQAVQGFLEPERVVAGVTNETALEEFKGILAPLNAEIEAMNPASAEMTKHALNAFLATSISFTNDIADVCEQYGADVEAVIRALKTDQRIGPKAYLFAGLGFSGGTLGRDLNALIRAGEQADAVPVVAAVLRKNRMRNAVVGRRLIMEFGDIKGRTFAFFGVTYKAGTSTLRRSQPLQIEKELRDAGAKFRLYDPWAKPEEVAVFTPSPFFRDAYEAASGADGILIMTPWRSFGELDFKRLRAAAAGTVFLFDTCNILCDKQDHIKRVGFHYLSIGR